jgi:hypothetical protein
MATYNVLLLLLLLLLLSSLLEMLSRDVHFFLSICCDDDTNVVDVKRTGCSEFSIREQASMKFMLERLFSKELFSRLSLDLALRLLVDVDEDDVFELDELD